jgi:hypothetical protein
MNEGDRAMKYLIILNNVSFRKLTKFSMFVSLFFAPHEYALVVSLLRAQQMEHNARQFVSRGRNRLWLAQFSGDPSKEFAKIVVRVMERIGCHSQRQCDSAPHAPTLGKQDFAAADLPLRAQT